MLQEGTMIAGRYRLQNLIGEGAMGEVWKAEDETLKRRVAIKMLFVQGGRDSAAMVDQFLREARIAASVQHRNVIQTVDFGVHEETMPFMVMELLNGESLEERLEREPAPNAPEFVQIASLTLRGLAAVHDAGIVHRDLKPANIFLQREPEGVFPKILDFGISRSLEGPSAISTQDGLIVGTPDYMSPEQARGEADIDRRSDIYSMGVILYQGLGGRLPFESDTVGGLIVKIVTETPPALREIAPQVPEIVSDVIAQAMARDREHRFVDARVMRTALSGAVKRAAIKSRTVSDVPPPSTVPEARAPAGGEPRAAPPPISMGISMPAPLPPGASGAPSPVRLSGGGGSGGPGGQPWGEFGGSLPPPLVSGPPGAAGESMPSFVDKDPFDVSARLSGGAGPSGGPGADDGRISLELAPRAGSAPATSGRPSFGSNSLPGDPLGARDESTGRLELDYDRGAERPRPAAKPRRRRAAPRQPARRRRKNPVPAIVAALLIAGLMYLPRVLLSAPAGGGQVAPEDPVAARPGSKPRAARRSGAGKHPPHLRDVRF